MLYIEKNSSQHIIHLIQKTKENYNLTNRDLSVALNTTETQISRWLNNQAKPNKTKTQKIWGFFEDTWTPGILQLSKNSHWKCEYFIEVMDIKNPFETFIFDEDYENDFDTFLDMIRECENLPYKIYRIYEPETAWLIHHTILSLNTTMNFLDALLAYDTLEEVFSHYKGLNPSAFDYDLIQEKKNERKNLSKT